MRIITDDYWEREDLLPNGEIGVIEKITGYWIFAHMGSYIFRVCKCDRAVMTRKLGTFATKQETEHLKNEAKKLGWTMKGGWNKCEKCNHHDN